jgi:endonuclease YncB( thermonuclease family)
MTLASHSEAKGRNGRDLIGWLRMAIAAYRVPDDIRRKAGSPARHLARRRRQGRWVQSHRARSHDGRRRRDERNPSQ